MLHGDQTYTHLNLAIWHHLQFWIKPCLKPQHLYDLKEEMKGSVQERNNSIFFEKWGFGRLLSKKKITTISVQERDNFNHSYGKYKVNGVVLFFFQLKKPGNSKKFRLILALISKKLRKSNQLLRNLFYRNLMYLNCFSN